MTSITHIPCKITPFPPKYNKQCAPHSALPKQSRLTTRRENTSFTVHRSLDATARPGPGKHVLYQRRVPPNKGPETALLRILWTVTLDSTLLVRKSGRRTASCTVRPGREFGSLVPLMQPRGHIGKRLSGPGRGLDRKGRQPGEAGGTAPGVTALGHGVLGGHGAVPAARLPGCRESGSAEVPVPAAPTGSSAVPVGKAKAACIVSGGHTRQWLSSLAGGRGVGWIIEALSPLRLPTGVCAQLTTARGGPLRDAVLQKVAASCSWRLTCRAQQPAREWGKHTGPHAAPPPETAGLQEQTVDT